MTIREVASLEALVMLGEVTPCVGGGTKRYLRHVEWGMELRSKIKQ